MDNSSSLSPSPVLPDICVEPRPPYFDGIMTEWITLIGFLVLMLITTFVAYRRGPRVFADLILAFVFAWGIEASAVYADSYHYYFAIVPLPGCVPLFVASGWTMVFFTAFTTAQLLFFDWKKIAVCTGLIALAIDLMLDPGAVGLKLWTWTATVKPWFNVPWSNFFGWAVLMFSLAAANVLVAKWAQPRSMNLILEKLAVFLFGYVIFAIVFASYQAIIWVLAAEHDGIRQTLLHLVIFGAAVAYIATDLPKLPQSKPIDWMVLAIPMYLIVCAFAYVLKLSLYPQHFSLNYHPLVFLIPFLGTMVMMLVYWPYRKSS